MSDSKEPWYTLPGETNKKDARMDMTEDNFYRVIGMRDEIIDEQKSEISSLKSKINKLEQKTIKAENELGEMCQAMIDMFNGGWDDECQRILDDEFRTLIDKNKRYIKKG